MLHEMLNYLLTQKHTLLRDLVQPPEQLSEALDPVTALRGTHTIKPLVIILHNYLAYVLFDLNVFLLFLIILNRTLNFLRDQ